MSGFWYPTAIAAATSIVLGLTGGLKPGIPTASDSISASQPAIASDIAVDPDVQQFERAMGFAQEAVSAFQSAQNNPIKRLENTRRERELWQASIQALNTISPDSDLYEQASAKQSQYQQLFATAEHKLAEAGSTFLAQIVRDAGISPERVHITLCQIDNPHSNIHSGPEKLLLPAHPSRTAKTQVKSQINSQQCRHHQGDELLASPASLIKLPIAIALLQKASAENIDLDQKIKIDPGNFTENAEGATLEIDQTYAISEIMARMIDRSDNIATNQLIDYVGRDRLAQTLEELGYVDTYAGHKLAGDRVMPDDMGDRINQSTTNDLTAMIVNAYSLQAPGEQILLQSLQSQTDKEIGHQALQRSAFQWLGEKTGQNRHVIGSTLAMQAGEDRYALTVAIDESGDARVVREIVSAIANHLQSMDGSGIFDK